MRASTIRDFGLVLIGLGMIIYETLRPSEPRWLIITAALVMLGLPAGLALDRKANDHREDR